MRSRLTVLQLGPQTAPTFCLYLPAFGHSIRLVETVPAPRHLLSATRMHGGEQGVLSALRLQQLEGGYLASSQSWKVDGPEVAENEMNFSWFIKQNWGELQAGLKLYTRHQTCQCQLDC